MDENYINLVRKSLYGDCSKNSKQSRPKMVRKSKKIRFASDEYKSEDVFKKTHSEKIKKRKSTPLKSSPKKKKIVASTENSFDFSSIESFGSEILPSISGTSYATTSRGEERLPELKSFIDEYTDDNVQDFNLNRFFNSSDMGLNESITEPHSGIGYEFQIDKIKEKKTSNRLLIQNDQITNKNCLKQKKIVNSDTSSDCDVNSGVSLNNTINSGIDSNGLTITDHEKSIEVLSAEEPEENAAEYFDFCYSVREDLKLVLLKEYRLISVYGISCLKVLHGQVEVLGSVLDENSSEVNIYSPRGSALLTLRNVTNDSKPIKSAVLKILPKHKQLTLGKNIAIIRCTKLRNTKITFLEKHISQQIFPSVKNNKVPQINFEQKEGLNEIRTDDSWDKLVDEVTEDSKLLFTGGKGVGKSTLLRYFINKLLGKFGKVRVVDLDPGQPEFTIPGCISTLTISEPIFGPNYTHLRKTERSILSDINVGHDPEKYVKSVEILMRGLDATENWPTLINYMGFIHGIGINILSSALTFVKPTDVVQIVSKSSSKNFKEELTIDYIRQNGFLFDSDNSNLDYQLHLVKAMNDTNDGWTLEPRQCREMCVLTYLGRMMSENVNSITSHKLPTYEIDLCEIELVDLKKDEIAPSVANANIVALCEFDRTTEVFNCLGYGIVRGIDLDCETLTLITPEPIDVLERVQYLVLGSVRLPPSIYMTTDQITGIIPYVMDCELVSLGEITKRSYLPANKK